jgi:hypothetical protein
MDFVANPEKGRATCSLRVRKKDGGLPVDDGLDTSFLINPSMVVKWDVSVEAPVSRRPCLRAEGLPIFFLTKSPGDVTIKQIPIPMIKR